MFSPEAATGSVPSARSKTPVAAPVAHAKTARTHETDVGPRSETESIMWAQVAACAIACGLAGTGRRDPQPHVGSRRTGRVAARTAPDSSAEG